MRAALAQVLTAVPMVAVTLGVATSALADGPMDNSLPTTPPPARPVTGPSGQDAGSAHPPPASGTPVDPAYGEHPENAQRGPNDAAVAEGPGYAVLYQPDRSRKAITTIAALGAAGVVFGAVGLYFHLDSRDASDAVSTHKYTGHTWTPDVQDTYDRARRSATIATVMYGIGGALLIATAVAYIVTEPPQESLTIHPHTAGPPAIVAPIPGGAVIAKGWRF